MPALRSYLPVVGVLFVALLLSACSTPRQSLSEPIQPLPNEEGAIRISTSVGGFSDANLSGNFQVAYTAPNKRISGGLNLYGVGPLKNKNRGDDYSKSWVAEGFVGTHWFKPLKTYQPENGEKVVSPYNGILFDVTAGYGLSNLQSGPDGGGDNFNFSGSGPNNGDFKFDTRHVFLQAGLLVKSKWMDVGMSLKGIGIDYVRGEVNGQRFSDRQNIFIEQAEDDGLFAYLETAFRFSAGTPKVKVFTTVSVISNVFGDQNMVHLPKPLMLGLEFNLNEFGK